MEAPLAYLRNAVVGRQQLFEEAIDHRDFELLGAGLGKALRSYAVAPAVERQEVGPGVRVPRAAGLEEVELLAVPLVEIAQPFYVLVGFGMLVPRVAHHAQAPSRSPPVSKLEIFQ